MAIQAETTSQMGNGSCVTKTGGLGYAYANANMSAILNRENTVTYMWRSFNIYANLFDMSNIFQNEKM